MGLYAFISVSHWQILAEGRLMRLPLNLTVECYDQDRKQLLIERCLSGGSWLQLFSVT